MDRVSGEFERAGKSEVCDKRVVRTRTFTAPTYDLKVAAGDAWTGPLRHKKCELL